MKDILKQEIPKDALIASIAVLIWSAPIVLAYLFVRFCIVNPVQSLFGVKK
jgi:hypothetical protein